jgi:cephalosporin hydroxylase
MKVSDRSLKQVFEPFVPPALLNQVRRYSNFRASKQEEERRAKFERLRSSVSATVSAIHSLTLQQCSDAIFLEHEFIPSLGLNDEELHEQPTELSQYFGRGLHIWQYPSQLADYLVWLSGNAKEVKCYMEIGCRWGGMFILVTEWLRKHGNNIQTVIAVDPIESTPFIDEYFKLLQNEKVPGHQRIEAFYIRDFSTSVEVMRLVERVRPDFVFIDGDHELKGALADHMLVRDCARIIVHHDVISQACPDTTLLWNVLKQLERHDFACFEFVDQYKSVNGNFLGIGVLNRKTATSFAQMLGGPLMPEEEAGKKLSYP